MNIETMKEMVLRAILTLLWTAVRATGVNVTNNDIDSIGDITATLFDKVVEEIWLSVREDATFENIEALAKEAYPEALARVIAADPQGVQRIAGIRWDLKMIDEGLVDILPLPPEVAAHPISPF